MPVQLTRQRSTGTEADALFLGGTSTVVDALLHSMATVTVARTILENVTSRFLILMDWRFVEGRRTTEFDRDLALALPTKLD